MGKKARIKVASALDNTGAGGGYQLNLATADRRPESKDWYQSLLRIATFELVGLKGVTSITLADGDTIISHTRHVSWDDAGGEHVTWTNTYAVMRQGKLGVVELPSFKKHLAGAIQFYMGAHQGQRPPGVVADKKAPNDPSRMRFFMSPRNSIHVFIKQLRGSARRLSGAASRGPRPSGAKLDDFLPKKL
ncbi:MAG: hypothetical protein JW839_02760 [Candidatus Lokiarchaeota archaeon]|nr:hypothetical protein [Candidatus Lokiarchaeota archaeon]